MGGTSTQQQSSQQQSQLTPYAPATNDLQGILGSLSPYTSNLGVTPGITNAFGQIEANSNNPNPYSAPASSAVLGQLAGGPNYNAATNTATGGYNAASSALSPYLSGSALNPATNPALASQLGTVNQQVQDTVNPVFSAAGRLGSPANAKAIASGIAQGDTGILQNAATNQIGAAGTIGGLGNSTGGVLGNLDASNAGIVNSGVTNAPNAYNMANLGPEVYLNAALQQSQLPINNAGSLAGILGPIAAQFGQQNQTGSSQGSSTMSGAQQFATIAGGFNSLMNPFKSTGGLQLPAFPS